METVLLHTGILVALLFELYAANKVNPTRHSQEQDHGSQDQDQDPRTTSLLGRQCLDDIAILRLLTLCY